MPSFTLPPSAEDFTTMAEAALAALPASLSRHLRGVSILVEDRPDAALLKAMDLDSPWELTGLYQGVPMTQASIGDVRQGPDVILLFREPILLEWIETGENLPRLVRSVLVHEIAHHFGFSDADIERLEADADDA
jgi:predicted Zn-dependent protease with MMP-like domain